jgi:hypothetical protein
MTSKCIHVVTTHEPAEIVALTRPLYEHYAEKVGAELRFISDRKFPDYPANYERMQVFESGRDYAWNMVVDAGVLVGPLLPDFTKLVDRRQVGLCLRTHAPSIFDVTDNKYFVRDGRDLGVVEAIVVTSSLTHDLWQPLIGRSSDWLPYVKSKNPNLLSELCLSLNAAKYRFDVLNPFGVPSQLYRLEQGAKPLAELLPEGRGVIDSWERAV